ncbi:MAG TPA: thioredoxin TrxC [Terriglobales bacterium]|nr:thioredoxin TrxC [Terriglobales bacterium]
MAGVIEIGCAACGAVNRVPAARAGEPARCGKCKAPLARAGAPVAVTDETFARVVLGASQPVILDCWADWCGPCHMLAPTVDALARDYAGRVLVAKLDVDANPATAGRFDVRSIPTVLVFRDGQLVNRLVGVQPRGAFDQVIRALLPAGV